jgi:hypothetical protein
VDVRERIEFEVALNSSFFDEYGSADAAGSAHA